MPQLEGLTAFPPHVLVVPFPAQSHINPMVHFSKVLASHGVRVTCALPEHYYSRIQKAQQPRPSQNGISTLDFHLVGLHNGLPLEGPRNPFDEAFRIEAAAEHLLEKLAQERVPVTCIIGDVLIPWTSTIAKKFALMDVVFCATAATAYAAYYCLPRLLADGSVPMPPADRAGNKKVVNLLPGMPQVCVTDLPRPAAADATGSGFQLLCDLFINSSKSEQLIVHSIYEVEKSTIDALRAEGMHTITVGPLIPYTFLGIECDANSGDTPDLFKAEESCLKWLDTKAENSVLYVSFGSVILVSPRQIKELAMGLEASHQPFLWVIRPGSIRDCANTEDALPQGFLSRTEDQGKIVTWAPQLGVLSHPSVGGFFLQFGWTSSLEGLSMGVPMMGTGVAWADNPLNLTMLEKECKIAIECKTDEEGIVEKEEVERVVREALQGEEGKGMRERAKIYKETARKAVTKGGSTFENLRAFVESLNKRALANGANKLTIEAGQS